jgi:hypothetical protein
LDRNKQGNARGEIDQEAEPASTMGNQPSTPPKYDDLSQGALTSLWMRLAASLEQPQPYWLTRFLILRWLGLVYFVAFLSLANQVVPLIGKNGLLPAVLYIRQAERFLGSRWAAFWQLPSLFWVGVSDPWLLSLSWLGVVLSLLVLFGYANAILMAVLWGLYLSFVHMGQDWYSYGWDIQLLETGFLAIFLCPLLEGRPFPRRPPPVLVIWMFRWLIFRIMLGAGLIKIRGDACWRDLTCLYYHYETQPIPNPLSRILHFMPHWFHNLGALWNHFNELICPWFVFGPRRVRHIAGILLFSFQVILIFSGNLSFLNWLTIVPALACFDDTILCHIFPKSLVAQAARARETARVSRGQKILLPALAVLVAILSIFPITNLLSPEQAMNTSFDPLHLVNTYGAFGSVGKQRNEIIFEGTEDSTITGSTQWKEYEFKCKPGDPYRRPCIISPYHYRLDWQIWFAAMSSPDQYPWTVHLVWKLLHNDQGTVSLLANNPFSGAPPRFVRADLYRYQFAPLHDQSGAWWIRTRLGPWLPPLSEKDPVLLRFLEIYGWVVREQESGLIRGLKENH